MKSKLSFMLAICLGLSTLRVAAQEHTVPTMVVGTQTSTPQRPKVGGVTIAPATIRRAVEQSTPCAHST